MSFVIGCGDSDTMKKDKDASLEKENSDVNETEAYQPSQPITFSHSVHSGIDGIDCKYCHDSDNESKSDETPNAKVCLNCHQQIPGASEEASEKIKKIYDAAGWDETNRSDTSKPITWKRVYNLPDSVYFNHHNSNIKSLECSKCHY